MKRYICLTESNSWCLSSTTYHKCDLKNKPIFQLLSDVNVWQFMSSCVICVQEVRSTINNMPFQAAKLSWCPPRPQGVDSCINDTYWNNLRWGWNHPLPELSYDSPSTI